MHKLIDKRIKTYGCIVNDLWIVNLMSIKTDKFGTSPVRNCYYKTVNGYFKLGKMNMDTEDFQKLIDDCKQRLEASKSQKDYYVRDISRSARQLAEFVVAEEKLEDQIRGFQWEIERLKEESEKECCKKKH